MTMMRRGSKVENATASRKIHQVFSTFRGDRLPAFAAAAQHRPTVGRQPARARLSPFGMKRRLTEGDRMETMAAILGRRTVPPAMMVGPEPEPAEIERLLAAAAAAPDHGRLRPFRFLLVRGESRAKLGELCARALLAETPSMDAAEQEKHRSGPTRAPLVVVAVARLQPAHPKIPEIEQIAAAAAATQNLLLAAEAAGLAVKWATGKPAYSPGVARGLGLGTDERILGFLYVGRRNGQEMQPGPRPEPLSLATEWPG